MASTYRVTITNTAGETHTVPDLTQDDVDALIDQHEVRDSAHPVGVVERQKADGSWVAAGGWDVRPRDLVSSRPAPTREDIARLNRESMEAAARLNDAHDRRENRRSYYLRTGR